MKNSVFVILLAIITTNLYGQSDFFPNNRLKENLNRLKHNSDSFLVQLHKSNNLSGWNENFLNLDYNLHSGLYSNEFNKKSFHDFDHNMGFVNTMPVYIPDQICNMPISKPNPSINCHMLIKKIEIYKKNTIILP